MSLRSNCAKILLGVGCRPIYRSLNATMAQPKNFPFGVNITIKLKKYMITAPENTVELHLSGNFLSGSPVIRNGLALPLNISFTGTVVHHLMV